MYLYTFNQPFTVIYDKKDFEKLYDWNKKIFYQQFHETWYGSN